MISLTYISTLLPFLLAVFLWIGRINFRERGLPPGPPTTLIVGNALQFPATFPYKKLTKWSREFGDIYSLKLFNKNIIVISSPKAVKSILDKQGSATGGRPSTYIVNMANDLSIILLGMATDIWKRGRKAIHTFLTPQALENYKHAQQLEYVQLLYDTLLRPKDIVEHVKRTTASTMTMLVYGSRCQTYYNSPAETFFDSVHIANDLADFYAQPPVDLIPILKYVPERWARWKVLCRVAKKMRGDLHNSLLKDCEKRMEEGMAARCYIENVLQSKAELGMDRREILGLGMILFDGGIETTAATSQTLILAFLNYPDIQKKAQEEIDMVVKKDTLPVLDDFENLPYLQALIKEVHRFRPVLPLGFPHVSTEEIKYDGHRIPEDAIIFMNIWSIFHDPEYFDDPDSFNPDRFLTSEFGTKPEVDTSSFRANLTFGAGRRICPGEYMGKQSLAQIAMNLLWAFSFSKDMSGTGGIDLDCYNKRGIEITPLPFTCNIKVRNLENMIAIKEAYARAVKIWEDDK